MLENWWILCIVAPLVLVITGGITLAFYILFTPTRTAKDRLVDVTGGQPGTDTENQQQVERLAEQLGTFAKPTSEAEEGLLRKRLVQAGYKSRLALEMYNAARVVLALSLPILFSVLLIRLDIVYMSVAVVVLVAIGYYLPALIVSGRLSDRQRRLVVPLPDALDLLVSSVEAGLGLDAAFRRVADEMVTAAPELSKEFQLVNHEISAGVPRLDALRHLEYRTGVAEVTSLVNMLSQAERFGTSIARSLRVHSDMTRRRRMLKAEEQAGKVSPKLTVVMILFLMPCLFIVIMGPIMVKIATEFFGW